MKRLVKYVYLTLTKNGFPTILGLVSFVVWEIKDYIGKSIRMSILGFWYWVTV